MVDSRAYRFAFLIHDHTEIPADFGRIASLTDFEIGLFLPQDHSDRFAEPKYIPHLLLLCGDELHVQPHPAYERERAVVSLTEIIALERAQFLLSAWIRLWTSEVMLRLPYPRREETPVKTFFKCLATKLPMQTFSSFVTATPSNARTSFTKELREELIGGETSLIEWCSSVQANGRSDLLALTTRRMIWISRANELSDVEEFGYRLCYTPLPQWRGLRHVAGELKVLLRKSGWTIPIDPFDAPDVDAFATAVQAALERA